MRHRHPPPPSSERARTTRLCSSAKERAARACRYAGTSVFGGLGLRGLVRRGEARLILGGVPCLDPRMAGTPVLSRGLAATPGASGASEAVWSAAIDLGLRARHRWDKDPLQGFRGQHVNVSRVEYLYC